MKNTPGATNQVWLGQNPHKGHPKCNFNWVYFHFHLDVTILAVFFYCKWSINSWVEMKAFTNMTHQFSPERNLLYQCEVNLRLCNISIYINVHCEPSTGTLNIRHMRYLCFYIFYETSNISSKCSNIMQCEYIFSFMTDNEIDISSYEGSIPERIAKHVVIAVSQWDCPACQVHLKHSSQHTSFTLICHITPILTVTYLSEEDEDWNCM